MTGKPEHPRACSASLGLMERPTRGLFWPRQKEGLCAHFLGVLMQPRKAPRRSRRSGNPRKCQAQGPTHNASPAVLPEAWRGRGRWLRVGGGSEACTPVPALLAPRRVLQFRLHTQPRANSGRTSPVPTQVDPAPRQLRSLSAQPVSLTPATSEQSHLGASLSPLSSAVPTPTFVFQPLCL